MEKGSLDNMSLMAITDYIDKAVSTYAALARKDSKLSNVMKEDINLAIEEYNRRIGYKAFPFIN